MKSKGSKKLSASASSELPAAVSSKKISGFEIAEAIITSVLIVLGVLYFYRSIQNVNQMIDRGLHYHFIKPGLQPILGIIWYYHLHLLLSLMLIAAGIFLYLKKQIGWTLAIITLFSSSLILMMNNKIQTDTEQPLNYIKLTWILLYILMFAILFAKPIREKYAKTYKTYFIIIIATAVILLDSYFSNRS
jgi:hypothetical protein